MRREKRGERRKVKQMPIALLSPFSSLLPYLRLRRKWSRRDLNPRPSACKADALPAELRPQGKNSQLQNFQISINRGPG